MLQQPSEKHDIATTHEQPAIVDTLVLDWEGRMAGFSNRGDEPPICPGAAGSVAAQACLGCARFK